ncbi:hypothetical protein ACN4EK_21665 [Pantanalinema rosaneae CENA516]|uniref:hypothetical protein n=1 Tax=Pantanalinema rosaneae TaxID=1620701 RepID=UPI003D6DC464
MGKSDKRSRSSRLRATSFELQGVSTERQRAVCLTLFGIFLIVQGSMFLLDSHLADLDCDRRHAGGMCRFVLSSLQGETVTPVPMATIERAVVHRQGKSRRIVLLTSEQKLYFPINSWFNSAENSAQQINAFLQDSTATTLKVQQDSRWVFYPLGLTLILLGGGLIWVYIRDWF